MPIKLVAISSRSSSGDDTPQFEHLLAALSSRFAALQLDNLAQVLSSALEQVCVALNVDCGSLLEFSEEGRVRGCCTRIRPGIDDVHVDIEPDNWRWLVGRLLDRQPVVVSRLQDLPMEALGERVTRGGPDCPRCWPCRSRSETGAPVRSSCRAISATANGTGRCGIARACSPRSSATPCSEAARKTRSDRASLRFNG